MHLNISVSARINIDLEWNKLTRELDKLTYMKQQLEAGIANINTLISKVKSK
jgi:hypothetical protein